MAMPRLTPPYAQARDDYDTFAALSRRLGVEEEFTEGRTSGQWLTHLYETWRESLDFDVPSFDDFWRAGRLRLPVEDGLTLLADFRDDPVAHRLGTRSGLIEIFCADIDGFGYDDCAGHPRWFEPTEWLGGPRAARYPLHLVANQPAARLHSQLDGGAVSQQSKVAGREPIRMHPADADARGLRAGDVVRVFNDRGACLAGVVLDAGCAPGGAAVDRAGSTRGPGRSRRDVRARQPQRAHRRRRHVIAGARLQRRARAGAGREVPGRTAAGARPPAAGTPAAVLGRRELAEARRQRDRHPRRDPGAPLGVFGGVHPALLVHAGHQIAALVGDRHVDGGVGRGRPVRPSGRATGPRPRRYAPRRTPHRAAPAAAAPASARSRRRSC